MFPSLRKKLFPVATSNGITWKTNPWKRKTTIFYANREIGYFKIKGLFSYSGEGELLDRPFQIKAISFWQKNFKLIDQINQTTIALIKMSFFGKTRLYVGDDVFRFKQNMWGTGSWWWQRENGTAEEMQEQLVKTSITNLFTSKGKFDFGNTKDSNLNALILAGLFVATIKAEEAAGAAAS